MHEVMTIYTKNLRENYGVPHPLDKLVFISICIFLVILS